jgi:class 3 adenylate cyclase
VPVAAGGPTDIVARMLAVAARLQGVAEPNTVVIAEGTRRLLGNLFELEDLGAKDRQPCPARRQRHWDQFFQHRVGRKEAGAAA